MVVMYCLEGCRHGPQSSLTRRLAPRAPALVPNTTQHNAGRKRDVTRHAGVATSLLQGGADMEQEDREDLTALHWAARLGQERVVLVLLDHGADVEVRVSDRI